MFYQDRQQLIAQVRPLVYEMFPILVLIGFAAGTLGSMIGVGGGIIIVPFLTFFGMQPAQIASTSLFAVTSTSVSSSIEYSRQKRIDYKLAISMAAAALPGTVLGAVLSHSISLESFRLYFAILLAIAGLYVLYKTRILREPQTKSPTFSTKLAVVALSFVAGVISSLFGVGGGIIFVPAMLLLLGIAMQRAAPTSQLILLITSIGGLVAHIALGHPDYVSGILLAAGAVIGGQVGARLSKRVRDYYLQAALGIVLIGVSAKLIYDWMVQSRL